MGVQLAFSDGCIITGNTFESFMASLMLTGSSRNTITNNDLSNTGEFFGSMILSYSSQRNTITKNTIHDNTVAVAFWNNSNNNIICNNDIIDNYGGIAFEYIDGGSRLRDGGPPPWPSIDNKIYHNNFIDNTIQAYDEGYNQWDDGYPSGGNYWSDYNGSDENGDGIGDTPYDIMGGSQDLYPLMEPWTYPIAIE